MQSTDLLVAQTGSLEPFAPLALRLRAPDGANELRVALERTNQRRIVELGVVAQHGYVRVRSEGMAFEVIVGMHDVDLVGFGEARRRRPDAAGVHHDHTESAG